MISRRPAENHFSFSGGRDVADEAEFRTWAERIKSGYGSFGRSNDLRVGPWSRRHPKTRHSSSDRFRWSAGDPDDDSDGSDTPSPPLWEKPHPAVERPLHPTPRAQAIARYRQEMMDLVKDAPETAYELSLKDIVELSRKPGERSPEKRDLSPKNKLETVKEKRTRGKKEAKKKTARSESMETGGLLLNMFVPASLGGRKSVGGGGGVTRSKVTPKPVAGDGGGGGGTESEWWTKSEFSESIGSSSTGSRSSRTRRKMSGCNPFFLFMRK